MKPKELLRYPLTDVDSRTGVVIEPRLKKRFGIDIALKKIGDKAAAKVDAKNPAQWLLLFQASKILVQLRIGNDRHLIGEFNVAAVADAARRGEILDRLHDEGVLDAKEVADFRRAHPDKARLAQLRQAITDRLRAIEAIKSELLALKVELAANGG
jgi:hypothetical protein